MLSFLPKQKLNVRSSTEGEQIGASDALGLLLCGKYFIKMQGYMVQLNKLYQDNKSTILLETNGCISNGRSTSMPGMSW